MDKHLLKMYKVRGIDPPKTAAEFKQDAVDAVKALPIETKKIFWRAMVEEGKNVGEARKLAGIEDVMVAAELVIQCHKTIYLPVSVEDLDKTK